MQVNHTSLVQRVVWPSAVCCGWIVAAVFVVAALSKLVDPSGFRRSLSTWTLVPPGARAVATSVVPQVEIAVGLLWVLGLARWHALAAMTSMLVVYTSIYGLHLAYAEPPKCACLSLIQAHATALGTARGLIVRNIVLMVLSAAPLLAMTMRSTPRRMGGEA